MSIVKDAERFLVLHDAGLETSDEPIDLLRRLTAYSGRIASNYYVTENTKLKGQLAEAQARVSEANARTRTVEHVNVQLETQISQMRAQCQTPRVQMQTMSRSSSMDHGPDLMADPSFVPCRDERCPRQGLHAAHEDAGNHRGPRRKKASHA